MSCQAANFLAGSGCLWQTLLESAADFRKPVYRRLLEQFASAPGADHFRAGLLRLFLNLT